MVIKYFSWIKDILNKSEDKITLPANVKNISDLINYLENKDKKYREVFKNKNVIKVAINKKYSQGNNKIKNDDEIAFFPPVTGG